MTKSMTEGNPLRLIFEFSFTLLLGNLLQQTYNMADSAIVGKVLGANALAAVGASSSVQFLVLGFCTGLCCGFGIPLAKYFGAGNSEKMRACIYNSALLTAGAAVIITAICASLCLSILKMLSVPDSIVSDAYSYLLIIFLGIPFTLLYNLLACILRAVGDSKTPFIFLAVSSVLNIFLDLLFIAVLGLGCAGAAEATIASQAISGILCLIYITKRFPQLAVPKESRKASGKMAAQLLGMGIPMGLQYSITAIGSMVMQSANNSLGDIYISGFTAGMRIKQFAMCPFDAIATGASVFCGQNLGAGKPKRIKKGIVQSLVCAVVYGIIAGLVLIFFGRTLSMLFIEASETEILDAAAKYLRCLGYFYWCLGSLCVLRMSIQGLGFGGRAIISGVLEMAARITVSMGFVGSFGYTAICFADQAAWFCAFLYVLFMCIYCVHRVGNSVGNS